MTIIEAINRIDALKPNNYSQEDKVAWLSQIDGGIKKEIIDTHEGGEAITFNGYNEATPMDTELLIPSPYDDVYIKWLEAQIDYANSEYGRYNNSMVAYNSALTSFERFYNRNHMPKGNNIKFF